jgi:hypothetical protein
VTTARFLEIFALGSLRDLPDPDALEAPGPAPSERNDEVEAALDDAFGLDDDESADEDGGAFDEATFEEEPAQSRFG